MRTRTFPAPMLPAALLLLALAVSASCRLFDFGPLTVSSYSPEGSQLSGLGGVVIEVQFSRAVNQTVTQQAFSITANGATLAGNVSWSDDRTLVFTPLEPLQNGVVYAMSVSTQAEDSYGVDLATAFAHTFSTKTSNTAPSVISSSPTDQSAVSNQLPPISISFSEAMNTSSVYSAFAISPSVAGLFSMSSDGTTMTFTPTQQLQWQTEYTVTMGTSAEDTQANTLGAAYTVHFFVGTNTTVPAVASVQSSDGLITLTADSPSGPMTVASGWETTEGLVVTFTEPVETSSASSSVTISPAVQSTIAESSTQSTTTLTYTFTGGLSYGTSYTVTVAPGILSTQGAASSQSLAYHFLVNSTSTQPPQVSAVYLLSNPGIALGSTPGPASYGLLSAFGQIGLDPIDYPPSTPTETYFDFYFNLANGATLNPLTVGLAFSTNITNNAASISTQAVQINPTSPAPFQAAAAGQAIARIYVTITANGTAGEVTLQLATSLTDSLGNALAQQFQLPLNDPY